MRNKILIPLIFIAIVAGAVSSVYAENSYMNTFNTTYGTVSTVLNNCTLCHPSGTSSHNAYSTAFRNAGRNFRTIENSDSDGDGFTNIVEINARTFPGNAASRPSSADTTLPTVTNFVIPSTATSLTVAITTFTATDNVGVTGHMVSESSAKPSASATGWSGSVPTSYTCSSSGAKTLYAWAKDAAGNVSASKIDSVTITMPVSDATLPTVTNFVIPSTSTSLTVPVTTFTASDNVGVTGYLITGSSTRPLASAAGWSGSAPASYVFTSAGTKVLYAWAKDAAGNVSYSRYDIVSVTASSPAGDSTRPTVTNFGIPSTSTSLTVAITTFTATDNVGVTGYLVSETSSAPSASATGWSGSAPTSYSVSSAGGKRLYAWAKDAAGNVSASRNDYVTVTAQPVSQGVKIFTAGAVGKYYADPAGWVRSGYRVNIWGSNATVKAQAVDADGKKIAGTFSYRIASAGRYGVMDMVDTQNLAYQKAVSLSLGSNYAYTVTANGVTANGTLYSVPAKCDSCHRKPEGHIADRSTWGDCRSCHNLSNVTHKHLYKFGASFQCYSCHSSDSTNADVHSTVTNAAGYTGLTCTTCHGDLSATQDNTFKAAGMAGLPSCTSCHDANHSTPAGASFSNSVGHGGMLCISCHGPSHRIQKPANLGIGGANNCSSCHTRVSHGSLSCGECHVSSWDPHLVPGASSPPTPPPPPDDDDDDDDDDDHDDD